MQRDMTAEQDNAIRNVARTLLTELRSKNNSQTYRQLLDKHSAKTILKHTASYSISIQQR